MDHARSSFLTGALTWIYDGRVPEACEVCRFDWSMSAAPALEMIQLAPSRYAALLTDRDGMAPAADGGWNATAYLWHLTDLARCWAERWVQVRSAPGSVLVPWDPDVLADARNYRNLPTAPALWAIDDAVAAFSEQCARIDFDAGFEHGDWGRGTVADGILWLAHEFVHHQLDVDARAVPAE